jgi:hypothetical protein
LVGPTQAGASISVTAAGLMEFDDIIFINSNYGLLVNNSSASVYLDGAIAFSVADTEESSLSAEESSSSQSTLTFLIDTVCRVESGELIFSDVDVASGSSVDTIMHVTGANSSITGHALTATGGAFDAGIHVDNGARINIDIVKLGDPPLITSNLSYGLYVDNASTARLTALSVAFSDVGVFCNNASSITALSLSCFTCNTGVESGSTGANELNIFGGNIKDSTNYDVKVSSATAVTRLMGTLMEESKVDINPSSAMYSLTLDESGGDEGVNIRGELHVGKPEVPTESVFGQGDSYTNGMLVYTYDDGTTTYTDVSTAAKSLTGSTFTFTGTDVDDAIYVSSDKQDASDYLHHFGVKAAIQTAAVANVGDIIAEYWNGSSWATVDTMSTDSGGNYLPHANNLFTRTGSEQIRYDVALSEDNWTKNDPPSTGTNRFWIRFRIATAITTAPVFEQFKLHPSRFEINSDGFPEYFGDSRPLASLPWSAADVKPAGTTVGNQDIWYSDNLDVGMDENDMTSGDRVTFHAAMPADMDTSSPVKFRVGFRAAATGTYNYTVRYTWATPNSTVYLTAAAAPATHPNEQSVTSSVSATSGELTWLQEDLYYRGAIGHRDGGFSDVLVVGLEADTIPGNLTVMIVDGKYTKWCEGEHLELP